MNKHRSMRMYLDDNIPVIVGNCPSCGLGDRTLILVDYVRNPRNEDRSTVYVKCVACTSVFQTNITEMTDG